MTESLLLSWNRYKYFPYEREFARREVASLFGTSPVERSDGLVVPLTEAAPASVARLTYFRAAVNGHGVVGVPTQVALERSVLKVVDGERDAPELRRQQTRYSAHGLHEYRGKYNPQVVRALGNIFGLGPRAWVLDPFCGSGTTLLESLHNGWNAVGIDVNPLAVLIANAKVAAIREIDHGLLRTADRVLERIRERGAAISHDCDVDVATLERVAGRGRIDRLPNAPYLLQWFRRPVLAQVAVALQEIGRVRRAGQRAVLLTLLSDALRDVSLQDPEDLRIRRRENPQPNYPLIDLFAAATEEKLERVRRARNEIRLGRNRQSAHLGDSRRWFVNGARNRPATLRREFDAVVTSPPYASALPYIDTQRLSLCVLGLVEAEDLRTTEATLIGNREIDRRERDAGVAEIVGNTSRLPDSVVGMCRSMVTASREPGNGFRRQNTPSLVYRYFSEMAEVFCGLKEQVKLGAPIALVVGRNRTTLGGQEFAIDTPALLADVACGTGLRVGELVELDAYFRFGMHQRNSIRGEALLILRR